MYVSSEFSFPHPIGPIVLRTEKNSYFVGAEIFSWKNVCHKIAIYQSVFVFKIILKEREQRKQQHLLEQTESVKDEKADQQCMESTPEDQLVSQGTKAGII